MKTNIPILGGYQTDFARNWTKEGKHVSAMIRETALGTLTDAGLAPEQIDVVHIGNFAAELYCKQGHLGGFVPDVDPAFRGVRTARHEAACASGSIALLAAMAEVQAGWVDAALVLGVESMKTVSPKDGGAFLGTASWYEEEAEGVDFPFPTLFSQLGEEYDRRYGLDSKHLAQIAAINYENAKKNPLAQTRTWYMSEGHACSTSKENPQIAGRLKVSDCSQVTDGGAGLVICSQDFAKKNNLRPMASVAGWGQATAPFILQEKFDVSRDDEYVLPWTRKAITDAYRRAEIEGPGDLDLIETHDCFTTSEYMAIEHFGLTAPGRAFEAIESGRIALDGDLPINASGGLIGAGHPVGATGVRQVLDCAKQIAGRAGDYQVKGASRGAVLNLGGSATTSCAFVISQ